MISPIPANTPITGSASQVFQWITLVSNATGMIMLPEATENTCRVRGESVAGRSRLSAQGTTKSPVSTALTGNPSQSTG